MDVTTISNAAAQNVGQFTAQRNSAVKSAVNAYANTAKQETAKNSPSAAYSVDISDAAAAMAKDSDELSVNDAGAHKTKGLTAEQVQTLKDDLVMQQNAMLNLMIQTLTANNEKLQGWLNDGIGTLNFGGVKVDASRFALPSVATNPEDAAKAIAEGGDWSVGAVSDRIFGLAETLAGGDPEKLQQMRSAVEEGFKQAGMTWKDATGNSSMPDITKNTYSEIMKRFENSLSKLSGGSIY